MLFLAVVCVYAANGRTIGAGDTLPARCLPWSLLQHRSFHLDAFPVLYDEDARRRLSPSVIGGPTSANSPDLLAASYGANPIPPGVFSGEQIVIGLTAANTGRAVWLATAPDELGAVPLGWGWFRGDREETGGRDYLLSDIGPGGVARFRVRIPAPAVPGDHTLVIDMVGERLTWFAARGRLGQL